MRIQGCFHDFMLHAPLPLNPPSGFSATRSPSPVLLPVAPHATEGAVREPLLGTGIPASGYAGEPAGPTYAGGTAAGVTHEATGA